MLLLQTVAEAEKTGLPPLPKPYLSDSGRLHLVISCGTLTPRRQMPTTPYVSPYVSPDPTVAPGTPPCALAIEWVESARLQRSPAEVERQHVDAVHGAPSAAALPLACPYALPAPDEPGARVNKRSRAMLDAPGELAPQAPTTMAMKDRPDASALLELATLHARFLTKIQEELERTDDNPDPELVEYHQALTKISAPLADATLCLSRLASGVRRAPAAIDGVHVRGSLRCVHSFDGISETSETTASTARISASQSFKSESSLRMEPVELEELEELEELAQVTSDAGTESSTQYAGWDAAAAAESLVDSFLA